MAKVEFRLGDLVLAKVKGFPYWPAKIARPEDWNHAPDPKKHFVQFFGTQEVAFVMPPDIQAFTGEAKNKLLQKCKGKTVKYFAQAVVEISTAFEESQNHKSDTLGNEDLLSFAESSLTKPEILDQADHREVSSDGKSDISDFSTDPRPGKLVENNAAETKPDIVATSPSSEPLEHGSPDPILKIANFKDKIDGVTCTNQSYGTGKNAVNVQMNIKKIAGDSNKIRKDELFKHVYRRRAVTNHHLLGPNQKGSKGQDHDSKKGEDHGSKKESCDNKMVLDLNIASSKKPKEMLKEKPIPRVCGEILGKKKRFESELGKSGSGVDESKLVAKRPRSEDEEQKQCKRKRLFPVGEGKAQGGKIHFNKEAGSYTKSCKQTMEHTSVPSFSGSLNKEGTNHPEQKISSFSDSDVKVPAVQLPKRRRLVCIYDDDDDDENPKTPVHGGHTNVPKAKLASTDGHKSANVSRNTSIKAKQLAGSAESAKTRNVPLYKHNKDASLALPDSMDRYDSPMGKPVEALLPKNIKPIFRSPKDSHRSVSFKNQVKGKNTTAKISSAGMPDGVEAPSNSFSMGKPSIKVPPQNVKQILRSPMKSPRLFLTNEQIAGQNKISKVSGVGVPQKSQSDSSRAAMAGSDIVRSSDSKTTNQRSKPALEVNPTRTLKVAARLNHVGVPTDTSATKSAGMIVVDQENGTAPLISSGMPDSTSSMKDLIAAVQAKRKQAHSHTPPIVNLDHNSLTIESMPTSPSPLMLQNVSSSAGDSLLIGVQEHQEDSTLSNHGHQSSSRNQFRTEENEKRRFSSGHRSVESSLNPATEAAISRDAFEGMIETLSRTKESIRRATRQAIDCAKYGNASEVVELLIQKMEIEPQFTRKVDLFFLVDSITQRSHSQKGIAAAIYIPTVQAALPRLLGAAAPPGAGARENRHQCRKVLKLWLKRKIFPDSLLRRYIGDLGASGDDKTVGFSLRCPSRSERAIDDPLRDMEGMLVDEYGSNATFQLTGFLPSHTIGDDEEDEDLPSTSQNVKNKHMEEPVHALVKLETHERLSHKCQSVVDGSGVLEMEDASCKLKDEVPMYVSGIGAKVDSPAVTCATELPPITAGSPPRPHESPPSPPPLPPSPPPLSPPPPSSSPLQVPLAPPPSDHFSPPPPAPFAPPTSVSLTRLSMPSHPLLPLQPGFAPPAYPLLQHEYHISMQRDQSSIATSNESIYVPINGAHGRHDDGSAKSDNIVTQSSCFNPNQQLQLSNTSFLQRPVIRNLAPAPSSLFLLPSGIVQSDTQRSCIPHPYPFPSQPVDGRQHMKEETWWMPSNGHNAGTQNGAWISGRNPYPGSLTVTDAGFFQPPPERPPWGTISYQLTANNLQGGPAVSGHIASQMLPSQPDVPFTAQWRPS